MSSSKQIKSKDRVRDLAEVLTAEREVKDMLALVDDFTEKHHVKKNKLSYDLTSTFLEPACGNGNFIVAILSHKLTTVKTNYLLSLQAKSPLSKETLERTVNYEVFQSLAGIYGIDIDPSNVVETRDRVTQQLREFYENELQLQLPIEILELFIEVLKSNIVLGDSLSAKDSIHFADYNYPKAFFVSYSVWSLSEIEKFATRAIPKKTRSRMIRFTDFTNAKVEEIWAS